MIRVEHVSRQFGSITAVRDLSFNVATGETLVLLGTSGCGKTTTLKMLNRLIEPTSGKIYVNGQDILTQSAKQLRRSMGYVIQQTGLFPHYTVEENVGIVPQLLGWQPAKIRERIYHLLERMGLPPAQFARKYPSQLSGGQQQRVGLARALAANPPIILMDEPFGALDPIIRQSIRQEWKTLEELTGKTTILVTHDVIEAVQLADQICLMDQGTVQQMGTPKALLMQPANEFVAQFFARQRFQLELMVHTIADVLPYLPAKPVQPEENHPPVIQPNSSLWELVTQRQEKRGKDLATFGETSILPYFTPEELVGAFSELKRKQSVVHQET